MDKLNVFTAFSGYDSQCMALDRLGIDYELIGWSEIDKYAIQAHNSVYPQYAERNYGDISKINWDEVPNFDLFTYSSPCQDFSMAGLQKGGVEGSGTRSSLLWECRKAIVTKKPKYLILENVKALTSKKFMPLFLEWQKELESYGYRNYWKVLNAKNYGIPQNRERVFLVSVADSGDFYFPKELKLNKTIGDFLEREVDEKYYLSSDQINQIKKHCERKIAEGCGFKPAFKTKDEIATCISTRYGGRQTDTFLRANLRDGKYSIRKLTERECFRLMGVSEDNIDKIQASGISRTQQCKMAGNSIVVDVLFHIFRKLFIDKECEKGQLSLLKNI